MAIGKVPERTICARLTPRQLNDLVTRRASHDYLAGETDVSPQEGRFDMPLLTALAISIGVLGGVATWAFVGPLGALGLQIWAAFIAWAAFYHSGGKEASLKTNIPAHIWGAVLGWLALLGVTLLNGSLGVPVAAGISVGVTVIILVLGANMPVFGSIPSAVYGFACVAAYGLLAGKLGTLTAASLVDNPLINIVISMIIGSLLGWLSQRIGVALAEKSPAAASA
jgi:hypothetical protein